VDLLTSMAKLSGLTSADLPLEIIRRRRDIVIESAAYDIIKQKGIERDIRNPVGAHSHASLHDDTIVCGEIRLPHPVK